MGKVSRREMIQILSAAAAMPALSAAKTASASLSSGSAVRFAVAEQVLDQFASIPFESQRIDGIFADRMQINVAGRLLRINEEVFLSAFIKRHDTDDYVSVWVGEHAGKFLDAACNAVRYRDNADLRRLMDRMVKALLAAQDADGYLGTYTYERRWTSWDVWVHEYTLTGLLSYYKLTGAPAVLSACRRIGDLLCRTFGEGSGQRDIVSGGSGDDAAHSSTTVLEPMCRLYRLTGEASYLEFCHYLVRADAHSHGRSIIKKMMAGDSVDSMNSMENKHAYTMLANFNGFLDLYRLTGDRQLLTVVLRAWEDIRQHQLYRTGTVGAQEIFQPPGRLLSLPASKVGENCATVTWLQFNWRLFRLTGEARFGQEIERTVYNHLLAAQDPQSGDFSYYTAWMGRKEFTSAPVCCVSSGPRGISLIPKLVWGVAENAFVVNLYTPGQAEFELMGVPVTVASETQFPMDGNVDLKIDPPRIVSFIVRLRVPEWSERFEATLGTKTFHGVPGTMLDIEQAWAPGSLLRIRMDMKVQTISGAPTYPDYLAIQRGPQVLALEKSLNPEIPYLSRVSVSTSSKGIELKPAAGISKGQAPRQVYALEGIAGITAGSDRRELSKPTLKLVPFADAVDYRIWLTREDRLRRDVPAITAYSNAMLSHSPPEQTDDYIDAGALEYLTDENPRTACIVDRRGYAAADFIPGLKDERLGIVWFAVALAAPATVSRIVFTHGALTAKGGWFDASKTKPQIEILKSDAPLSVDPKSMPQWEVVGSLESYPSSDGNQIPPFKSGASFEIELPRPVKTFGIRVVGIPAKNFVSCAEFCAFT